MELLETVHRGVTHSRLGMSVAMDWFVTALGAETTVPSDDLVFLTRELLMGSALVAALLSLLPLLNLLLATSFFAPVVRRMPGRFIAPKKSRRRAVLGSVALSGALYPFLTQLGHGLFPYPKDLFRTLMAGGLILWLCALALVSTLSLRRWYKKGEGRSSGVSLYDLGLSFEEGKGRVDWNILGRIGLIALIMFAYLYSLVAIGYSAGTTDLRFIWPFLRPLTPGRAAQVALYLPFFFFFFLVNGGARLYGRLRLPELSTPARTQWYWWADSVAVMLGGLVLVAAFEYLPFLAGYGTGWALLGLSLFDGPFMSALVLIVPQFLVLFFVSTYFFRKTGTVYLGSLVTALIVSWITCGGAAYF
jgi:hypothetical protein